MARTKAQVTGNSSASATTQRRVAGAKAPRKFGNQIANYNIPNARKSSNRSGGMSPLVKRPTPSWQKGIDMFLRKDITMSNEENLANDDGPINGSDVTEKDTAAMNNSVESVESVD